jgi:2-polyprenyl-6-methoxyphenol hydroxylase-like FAD-dependent oxidoreductase
MVILGIAPLPPPSSPSSAVIVLGAGGEERTLLRDETQAQWLDGSTRVFSMPFGDGENLLWQLSFPYSERDGLEASSGGGAALKLLAQEKLRGWPEALVSLVDSTGSDLVSGHPVYDRDPEEQLLGDGMASHGLVSLIGDAAHPMSPFKAQGANQALLDAVSLAQALASTSWARPGPGRRSLQEALRAFEAEMRTRSRSKVVKSREAAALLHSPAALVQANITRSAAAASLSLGGSPTQRAEAEEER